MTADITFCIYAWYPGNHWRTIRVQGAAASLGSYGKKLFEFLYSEGNDVITLSEDHVYVLP